MLLESIKSNKLLSNGNSLFNAQYYCEKNGGEPDTAIFNFVRSISEGIWKDFHPLICIEDFENSGSKNLQVWITSIFNPNESLVSKRFVFFHPILYRQTASELRYQNELIDYMVNGSQSGGFPHPFCDIAYASLIGALPSGPFRHGDAWSEAIAGWPDSAPVMSPFFDAYDFNHKLKLSGLIPSESDIRHPLRLFYYTGLPQNFHSQVIQSCLSFALFEGDLLSHFSPRLGWEVIDMVARFLVSESEAAGEIKTSICILNYNKLVHTYFCAVSAAMNSDSDTEIIVFDNGSNSYEAQALLNLFYKHPRISVIRSKKNLYFGEGNNVAKDFARGQYLYFLNNDAYVSGKTIRSIVSHMDSSGVAAAGCTFLFPDGFVQEVGGLISDCGQQIQQHKMSSLVDHMSARRTESYVSTQYISSANFCVRRDVLEEIGAYDYIYEPLYFEDTDLCKRITETGREIHLLPETYVIHVENASTREFLGDKFMHQIAKNRATFKKRWEYKRPGYMPRNVSMYYDAFKRVRARRPTAFVYSPYPISVGGGERYILSVVRALSTDFNVKFVVPGFVSLDRVAFVMSDLGITLSEESCISVGSLDDLYMGSRPDVMVVMGNEIVPPVPMVGRLNIHHCQFPFPAQNEDRFEYWRLKNVDAVLVNSQFTARNALRSLTTWRIDRDVEVISPPVQIETISVEEKHDQISQTFDIVSVGRFDPHGHSKNQHVIIEIFNEFQKTHPHARLTLIGGCSGAEHQLSYIETLRKLAGPNVSVLVNSPREELRAMLERANVYIHACGYGASVSATPERHEHFGISIVEAMASGCIPLVYDSAGPAEIVKPGAGWTYGTVPECVNILTQLAAMTKDQLTQISRNCQTLALDYSDANFDAKLLHLITSRLGRPAEESQSIDTHLAESSKSAPAITRELIEVSRTDITTSLVSGSMNRSSLMTRIKDALWCGRFVRFKGIAAARQAFADICYLRTKPFDEAFYTADPRYSNPRNMDALVHYVLIGAAEGLTPDFRFSPRKLPRDLTERQNPYVSFLKAQS